MTEKARKLWLEIGRKWSDVTLGKKHDDEMRDICILTPLFLFDIAALATKNKKMTNVGGIATLMVLVLEYAKLDYIDEEILDTMREATKTLEAIMDDDT